MHGDQTSPLFVALGAALLPVIFVACTGWVARQLGGTSALALPLLGMSAGVILGIAGIIEGLTAYYREPRRRPLVGWLVVAVFVASTLASYWIWLASMLPAALAGN